jgi:hypothetical protein
MSPIEIDQAIELSKDLNPVITKGMMGFITEIVEPGKTYKVEFPKEDEGNYEFEGKSEFTITADFISAMDY